MDLFGDALRDRQNGHQDKLLTLRRSDGHVDAQDPGLYFAAAPLAHETGLLERVEGPALDVGCGAGRTLLWLEGQGVTATGLDLSRGAVEVARQRGCRDVRLGDILADRTDPLGGDRFQTVLLFGNNIGIGGTLAGAAQLLRRIHQITRPGGQLLATGLDVRETENPRHLAHHRRNLEAGRPRGAMTLRFEYDGAFGDWFPWIHPEPHEFKALARETGWEVVEIAAAAGPFYAATLRKPETP